MGSMANGLTGGGGRKLTLSQQHGAENPTCKHAESIYNSAESRSRYEAYSRLQASAVAFGEKLQIPEIVALGGQSDGKSSLLEALLGFRFNVRDVEMGTRRPLMLQMLHDPTALEPRCRLQEEDADEYGPVIVPASSVADAIRVRTDECLKKLGTAVSSKPIIMRAEYAFCPNLTIIDTPGFVLKAKKGEPENTPEEILSMVRTLAAPQHRLILFLQQSSVEWCSSLWLDAVKTIDPSLRRTVVVVSKFDNRLKEFQERWEVDRYLTAGGYLGDSVRPFFVALPKDRAISTNDEFRRQIASVDAEVLRLLRENIAGGFDEESFAAHIGFGNLRHFLEAELQRRYRDAAPETLALLDQRCREVSAELASADAKLVAASDVRSLRRMAMIHASSVTKHMVALLDGVDSPDPAQWGCTSEEERTDSGFGRWPGQMGEIEPLNGRLRMYGGAAFERVLHEFKCVACSIECPPVSKEKVVSVLQAHAGRRGGHVEAAFVLAQSAARSWLGPLVDTVCHRLAHILRGLYNLAVERMRIEKSSKGVGPKATSDLSVYVAFHAALRQAHDLFIHEVANNSKDLVRHDLAAIISCFSEVSGCESNVSGGRTGAGVRRTHDPFSLQNSEELIIGAAKMEVSDEDGEFVMHQDEKQTIHHGNGRSPIHMRDQLRESQMTVPETPTPEQAAAEAKREFGVASGRLSLLQDPAHTPVEAGGGGKKKKRRRRSNGERLGLLKDAAIQLLPAGADKSIYRDVCTLTAAQFGRIREMLVARTVHTLNEAFLVACRDQLALEVSLELFAVSDQEFFDMFVAPGAIEKLESERIALQKRCTNLLTCLQEFRTLSRTL